jgi:hypothetical protein
MARMPVVPLLYVIAPQRPGEHVTSRSRGFDGGRGLHADGPHWMTPSTERIPR